MVIGGIDREETKKVQKKQSRSELLKKRQENEHRQASCSHSSLVDNLKREVARTAMQMTAIRHIAMFA